MRFTFIHTADIHLDSPLRGLERYDGAPVEEVRTAARRALENLVDHAVDTGVAFVLIAGDVYDGDWRDYNTGLFFASQMSRLREAQIRVYLISGNHDAASHVSRSLRLPDNVQRFSTDAPQTVMLDDLRVAIHAQGFANARLDKDLTQAYPEAKSQHFNIGLLHTSLDGRPGHDAYAPCSLAGLLGKEYDYWALGHVHHRVNRNLGASQQTQQYFQTEELRTLLHEARDLLITRLLSGERNTRVSRWETRTSLSLSRLK